MTTEKLSFQADISELMNLIIHAFYSNRDVFLREVISNSSDALDKQRCLDLQNNRLDQVYRIRLSADQDQKQLILEDTGVGMSREDLIEHLSTIARSGTKQFFKELQKKSDQIGQFGVGFYSVFLVADRVDVYSQKQGCGVYNWSSDAQQYYTLNEVVDGSVSFEFGHGTRLVLSLKEDAHEYLEEATLRRIVSTHSSFITYPVELWASKEIEVETEEPKTADAETVEEVESESETDGAVETVDENSEPVDTETTPAPPKKEKQTVQEWEVLNEDKPIWSLSPSDVRAEDYQTLYKTLSKDYDDALFYRHFQTEGAFEFKGVLFIPKRPPFDPLGDRQREKRKIRLYVKNVLVLNELDKEMIPDWMNFVVGVIDSADLPLNVSREMLQQTKVLKAMKSQLKKQILTMLDNLLDDKDKYTTFYEGFQKHVKLGVHEGDDSLLRFLRIAETASSELTTLEKYVDQFKEGQNSIYFATGPDAEKSVFTRLYKEKGYNVLLFKDAIDEFMLQRVNKFKDFPLVNINKEHDTPWQTEVDTSSHEDFCVWVKEKTGDTGLEKARISATLTNAEDAPMCVLSSRFGWSGNMERIMMSQPLNDAKSMFWMKGKKILDLNIAHPITQRFLSVFQSSRDDPHVVHEIRLLYRAGLVAAGFPLEDSSSLFEDMTRWLSDVSSSAPSQEKTLGDGDSSMEESVANNHELAAAPKPLEVEETPVA